MSATEPTIICPKCRTEIKITESLAAPLVESIRRDYEERLTRKDTDKGKPWKYLLIPHDVIADNMTLEWLASQFEAK